jgi:hypothetical protein
VRRKLDWILKARRAPAGMKSRQGDMTSFVLSKVTHARERRTDGRHGDRENKGDPRGGYCRCPQ